MVWWAVIAGTLVFSISGLVLIYITSQATKNLECQIPLGARALVMSLFTSWSALAIGAAGFFPFPSIYLIATSFGSARPVGAAEWILLISLVFQLLLHFLAFYFFTERKEKLVRKEHYIATGKQTKPFN